MAGAVEGSRPTLQGREVMGLGSNPGRSVCGSLSGQVLSLAPSPAELTAGQEALCDPCRAGGTQAFVGRWRVQRKRELLCPLVHLQEG